ncbi:MAG: DUF1553 domain-containing protein [Chthoniobacter sp.]
MAGAHLHRERLVHQGSAPPHHEIGGLSAGQQRELPAFRQGGPAHRRSENHLLWRANIQRLEGEEIRDAMLFTSGWLDLQIGGKTIPLHNPRVRLQSHQQGRRPLTRARAARSISRSSAIIS